MQMACQALATQRGGGTRTEVSYMPVSFFPGDWTVLSVLIKVTQWLL